MDAESVASFCIYDARSVQSQGWEDVGLPPEAMPPGQGAEAMPPGPGSEATKASIQPGQGSVSGSALRSRRRTLMEELEDWEEEEERLAKQRWATRSEPAAPGEQDLYDPWENRARSEGDPWANWSEDMKAVLSPLPSRSGSEAGSKVGSQAAESGSEALEPAPQPEVPEAQPQAPQVDYWQMTSYAQSTPAAPWQQPVASPRVPRSEPWGRTILEQQPAPPPMQPMAPMAQPAPHPPRTRPAEVPGWPSGTAPPAAPGPCGSSASSSVGGLGSLGLMSKSMEAFSQVVQVLPLPCLSNTHG